MTRDDGLTSVEVSPALRIIVVRLCYDCGRAFKASSVFIHPHTSRDSMYCCHAP